MELDIQLLSPANADLLTHVAPEVFDHTIKPPYLAAFLALDVRFAKLNGQLLLVD